MTTPVVPKKYQALVGRKFKDIGPNGMNRSFKISEISFMPLHQYGPWLAKCYAYKWHPPFKGPRYRKIDRFFQPGEYEEQT